LTVETVDRSLIRMRLRLPRIDYPTIQSPLAKIDPWLLRFESIRQPLDRSEILSLSKDSPLE